MSESTTKESYVQSVLKQIEFGTVTVTVHNGEITQVDVTEKKRFPNQKKTN
ncbi:YezD family protein [Paenalkalicoccus suaedae]|uniref:YezD family protein n=1 Tax=Paenalkalicoccus suaedae TaxID=2592382 RepID=A0A859F9W8_9BACI|nr:YezD family protein [Paenalkalicoccus suaedae]QKS70003.1 YezD family protein [Paenalkalicoccus suaedae]